MTTASDPASSLRQSVYLLLSAAAVAIAFAKVVGAENVLEPSRYKSATIDGYGTEPERKWPDARPEPTPAYGSNDKSRWATVRALVDDGTFVIGKRVTPHPTDATKKFDDQGIIAKGGGYETLDVVLHPETKEFYSSKPPLMPVVIAGEYWLLKKAFGWSIVRDRWLVIPTILITINVIPFAVYLVLLARLIETTGKTDFGRLFAFAAACFGTFLTAFSGTLNNHTPAAFAVLFAVYPIWMAMAENRDLGWSGYVCCGFFCGLSVTFEFPATAFLAGVGLPLLIARPKQTLLFFLPAALVPIAALLAANHWAMGQFIPTYAKFDSEWYKYEGSHWSKAGTDKAKGIDFAAERKDRYAFHLLFGHHGWFSLTPVWLLALYGLILHGIRSASDIKKLRGGKGSPWTQELFAGMTLVVSAVVIAFYVFKSNNYGGNTSGPRWLFWLTPLWLLALPSAADRLAGSRLGRGFAAVLLGLSVVSVFYPAWNPWRSPWIMQLLEFKGWLRY